MSLDRACRGGVRRYRRHFQPSGYRVAGTELLGSWHRRIHVESTAEAGCPSCGVASTRAHSRRRQRARNIPVGGPVEVVWSRRRFFRDEYLCPRRTFAEETVQVPRRARSARRLRDALVRAVIGSGRAAAETAAAFGVSWWLVQRALNTAALTLPNVDKLAPRMLGVDEHRYRSVRSFRDPATRAWKGYEPWMTTIVGLGTGQVLGIVDGRDSEGVGNWLFARSLEWRLGVQVVAIDPSAVFRKALRMWLPRIAASVDAFHLAKLGNDMLTGVRQRLTQHAHGQRGRGTDPVRANRRLLLRAGDALSGRGRARLGTVFGTDDPAGTRQAAWQVKEQLRDLLATGSLEDAAAKDRLQSLAERAGQPETTQLRCTVCRCSRSFTTNHE